MTVETTGVYGCDCGKAYRFRVGSEGQCSVCKSDKLTLLLAMPEGDGDQEFERAGDPFEDLRGHIAEQDDAELVTPLPDSETMRVRGLQSPSLGLAVWSTEYYEPVYREGKQVGLAMRHYEYTLGEVVG